MRPSADQPCASIAARTASHARASAASLLTRPLTMSVAPDFELRLDEADEPRRLGGEFQHMRQHEPLRNEAHVDDDRRRPLAETLGVKRARIDAFERADARVRGEARIELSTTDIDGDDFGGAAREQDIGKASGRGADVEADEARGIEPECVERGGKLDPAARDIRVGRLGLDRRVVGQSRGRLGEHDPADADKARGDCSLRPRPARKEAALNENDIRALAHALHLNLFVNARGAGIGRYAPDRSGRRGPRAPKARSARLLESAAVERIRSSGVSGRGLGLGRASDAGDDPYPLCAGRAQFSLRRRTKPVRTVCQRVPGDGPALEPDRCRTGDDGERTSRHSASDPDRRRDRRNARQAGRHLLDNGGDGRCQASSFSPLRPSGR